jgi:hypothetical protein
VSNIDVGDIVEWMDAPVLCLSTPQPEGHYRMAGMGAYLRRPPEHDYFDWAVGEVRQFNFGPDGTTHRNPKKLWTKPLTDEEEALAMRLLLGA